MASFGGAFVAPYAPWEDAAYSYAHTRPRPRPDPFSVRAAPPFIPAAATPFASAAGTRNPFAPPPPQPQPTGDGAPSGASPPGGQSRAGRDCMLLLLRANVPSMEILAASTDREFGLLALKYGIELPMHLSHLPTLPAPKAPAPPEPKVAPELKGAPIKDRPPREIRMRLKDATKDVDPSPPNSRPTSPPTPPISVSSPSRAISPPPEQDELMQGKGAPLKERAPSTRRPRKGGGGKSRNRASNPVG